MQRRHLTFDGLLFFIFCLVVCWVPFPAGSNRPWAWSILETSVLTLLGLYLVSSAAIHRGLPEGLVKNGSIIWIAVLWLLTVFVQLLPLPPWLLESLSPRALAAYQGTLNYAQDGWFSLSIDRGATLSELLKYTSYVAVLVLTLVLVDTQKRRQIVLLCMVLVSVTEGLLAVYSVTSKIELVSWAGHYESGIVIPFSGTFASRNHYGAHTVFGIAAAVGLYLSMKTKDTLASSLGTLLQRTLNALLSIRSILTLVIAFLVVMLFLSASRGALLAIVTSSVILLAVSVFRKGSNRLESTMLIMMLAGGTIATLWFGAGDMIGRFQKNAIVHEERFVQWRASIHPVEDYILVGSGAGTYETAFGAYRDGSLRAREYDHAHSDYLETLLEQGIIGTLILGLLVALSYIRILRRYLNTGDYRIRAILMATMLAGLALLVTAIYEYNFRIPSNALWYYVFTGIGLSAAVTRRKTKRRKKHSYSISASQNGTI